MKRPMLMLTLFAAPALALCARQAFAGIYTHTTQVAVHQTPAAMATISIPMRIDDMFRIVSIHRLPRAIRLTLIDWAGNPLSVSEPAWTARGLHLRPGEYVYLQVAPLPPGRTP
jgi:hypothetical protein